LTLGKEALLVDCKGAVSLRAGMKIPKLYKMVMGNDWTAVARAPVNPVLPNGTMHLGSRQVLSASMR
jgi:hypothetical protein